jgi:hypothetical protein
VTGAWIDCVKRFSTICTPYQMLLKHHSVSEDAEGRAGSVTSKKCWLEKLKET